MQMLDVLDVRLHAKIAGRWNLPPRLTMRWSRIESGPGKMLVKSGETCARLSDEVQIFFENEFRVHHGDLLEKDDLISH